MAAIARTPLDTTTSGDGPERIWTLVAREATTWLRTRGLSCRDAIVLVPFAQLLPPARHAFAALDGWQPRIETTQTLARSLGPASPAQAAQLSFDPASDRLLGARLLRSQPAARAWADAQPRRFDRAVAAVVETAGALARAAAGREPGERAAYWRAARECLGPIAGPGARERSLARIALEWAAVSEPTGGDGLFALRPVAWIVVQAGGIDPLSEALVRHSDAPALWLDADALASVPAAEGLAIRVCDGLEDEAQAATAQILAHVSRRETPVALVVLDRQVVRRVRALLERAAVAIVDETGWTLSTTRAAATVMLSLRAAAERATSDTLLEWLKSVAGWGGWPGSARAQAELERHCRRWRLVRVADFARLPPPELALHFWGEVDEALTVLRGGARPVARWLDALRDALRRCGAWDGLQGDAAGQAVLAALRLDPRIDPAWQDASSTGMTLTGFTAWVDGVLEASTFIPPLGLADEAAVVVTPLARAMLRPFAAVVCPGADDRHLGARPAAHALLGDAELRGLGLPDATRRQQDEALAWAHLLRLPRVTLLRRRQDEGEPLGDSPLVERHVLELARNGRAIAAWRDPRPRESIQPVALTRPAPSAPSLLAVRLTASAAEALRACPYRYFACHLLALREPEELDEEARKRDYGTWLHAVLNAFHARRRPGVERDAEAASLLAVGRETQRAMGLGDQAFLPYAESFEALVPRYLDWLRDRDAAGIRWEGGEIECRAHPRALGGVELHGVIDRVDLADQGAVRELIDYKTGSADALRRRVREPQEDTQLAFYAALQAAHDDTPLRALYLALDGRGAPEAIEHPEVGRSARRLVQGLAEDLRRLRGGAGLPALGEGPICDHCEARGLCRRDHWAEGGEA